MGAGPRRPHGQAGSEPHDQEPQRETRAPEERKLVSAVIWNRLAKGMPLQIDATLRYGLGIQGTLPIKVAQQRNPTPYNTSLHHFFTASAEEFCKKAAEYGYHC